MAEDNDFLKLTIQNIWQKLIEIDTKISNWDERISKLETRLTILETEKQVVSGFLKSKIVQKVITTGILLAVGYLTGSHVAISQILDLFK